ncbi:MAG: YiiX/YebB-like N1pC/P60 family cysteine hydrolase [Bacteroidota bacterium]
MIRRQRVFRAIAAFLLASSLAGCGMAPSATLSRSEDSLIQANAVSSSDQSEILDNAVDAAEQLSEGTPEPTTIKGTRGGLLYRSMCASSILRTIGYKIAYYPVKRKFSKSSKSDKLPRFGAADLEKFLGILKPGDLIQCGNDGSFVHSIFYVGNDEIVHALAQAGNGKKMIGVVKETLTGYFTRVERDQIVILRPHWTPETLAEGIEYARAQVGKDYDTLFLSDAHDRFFCTELCYAILRETGVSKVEPHQTKGKWKLVTNEDFRACSDLELIYRQNHD